MRGRFRRLRRLRRHATVPIVDGNRIEVLPGGRGAFEAMLDAIHNARRSLAVEMYTWSDDRLGKRFAHAVASKALEGVPVSVVVDAFGSLDSGELIASLQRSGVEVLWYHPLAPWTPSWYPNRRDHRKLLIVDGAIGFAGGMNLSETFSEEFLGPNAWRDTMVRVEGPAVRPMTRIFLETWRRCGGSIKAAGGLLTQRRSRGSAGVQVVGWPGFLGRRSLRRIFLGLIFGARRRIFIANGYFAPEGWLRRALCRAARRGVQVELLLPKASDVPLVRWAGRASYERLLEAGARIREMDHAILHAKVAVFDDEILLTGSANLDYRSFRHNLEVAVNVFDVDAARTALGAFEEDFTRAREVTLERWRSRPASERFLEAVVSVLRYWL